MVAVDTNIMKWFSYAYLIRLFFSITWSNNRQKTIYLRIESSATLESCGSRLVREHNDKIFPIFDKIRMDPTSLKDQAQICFSHGMMDLLTDHFPCLIIEGLSSITVSQSRVVCFLIVIAEIVWEYRALCFLLKWFTVTGFIEWCVGLFT